MHFLNKIILLTALVASGSAIGCLSNFVRKFLSPTYVTVVNYEKIPRDVPTQVLKLRNKYHSSNNAYPDVTSDYVIYMEKLEMMEQTFSQLQNQPNWNARGKYVIVTENPGNITDQLQMTALTEFVAFKMIIAYFENDVFQVYSWFPYKRKWQCEQNVIPVYLGTCDEINEDPFRENLPDKLNLYPLSVTIHHYRDLQKHYYQEVVNAFGDLMHIPDR